MHKILRKTSLFSAALGAALIVFAPAAQASSLSVNWTMASIWEGESGQLASHRPLQSRSNTTTADGRLAVFWAEAGNLVAGDTNNVSDIFMFDRVTKVTQRLNIGSGGEQGNGHTRNATISADGRFVGFTTLATNTAAGPQCIPGHDCAFSGVLDRSTGAITVASKNANGQLLPVTYGVRPIITMHPAIISGDGQSFLFSVTPQASADRTQDIFVRNVTTGEVNQINLQSNGQPADRAASGPSISNDGRRVAFSTGAALLPTDTNGTFDVYMRDVVQGSTSLVSHAHQSQMAANNTSEAANISGNGQFVVFKSVATNLSPEGNTGVGQIFLYNTQTNGMKQVSVGRSGEQSNGPSYDPSISADGSHITFMSNASNLVGGDTRDLDLFLYYHQAGITRKIKLPPRPDVQMALQGAPVINGDGKAITYLLFTRSQTNPAFNAYGIYFNYDPVSHIPFYDPEDILDLLQA